MAGLDTIKGYDDGGEVSPLNSGVQVKQTAKGPVLTGTATADEELLRNMEAFLEERNSPLRTLNRGLERMSAWAVPSLDGQKAQALNTVLTRQEKEDQEAFNQQNNVATMRAALAQQEAFNKARLGGAGGTGLTGKPGAMMYNGIELPPELQAIYTAPGLTKEKWDKEFNTWAQNTLKERSSAASQTQQDYYDKDGNLLGKFTPAEWSQRKPGVEGAPKNIIQPMVGGGVNASNIQMVESGGKPGLVSPKGAEGVMQVMPNTQKDPGFGVTPAKDNSQEELARVGRDYYAAMQNKYGHDTLAAIAYNMGPKATDDWIAKGGNIKDLPAETRDYVSKVHIANAMQSHLPTTKGAVTTDATVPTTTVSTAPGLNRLEQKRQNVEASGAFAKGEAQKTGELYAPIAIKIQQSGMTAGDRSIRNDSALKILEDNDMKDMIGKFQKGGKGDAFVRQLEEAIEAGQFGTIGVKGLQENLSKLGATPTQIEKFGKLAAIYKQNELDYAKEFLAGSGAVSDNERRLVKEAVGSVTDPIGKLRVVTATMKERADFDKEVNDLRKRFGKGTSIADVLDSPEYADIEAKHNLRLAKIFNVDPESLKSNNAYNLQADGAQSSAASETKKSAPINVPKDGTTSKDRSGKPIIVKNGKWVYQ